MDCWKDVKTPQEHLAKSKWILDTFLPWEADRCRNVELTRRQRHPRRRISADRAQADRPAALPGQGGARAGRRRRPQRPDHPEQARTTPSRPRGSPAGRHHRAWRPRRSTRPSCRRPLTVIGTMHSSSPAERMPCCRHPPHVLNIMGSAQAYPASQGASPTASTIRQIFFPWFIARRADRYLQQLTA